MPDCGGNAPPPAAPLPRPRCRRPTHRPRMAANDAIARHIASSSGPAAATRDAPSSPFSSFSEKEKAHPSFCRKILTQERTQFRRKKTRPLPKKASEDRKRKPRCPRIFHLLRITPVVFVFTNTSAAVFSSFPREKQGTVTRRNRPYLLKKMKEQGNENRSGGATQQVPDSSRQVRDLLKFLRDLCRRAAARGFSCF